MRDISFNGAPQEFYHLSQILRTTITITIIIWRIMQQLVMFGMY